MKKIKTILLSTISIIIFNSCEKKHAEQLLPPDNSKKTVLFNRESSLPLVLSSKKDLTKNASITSTLPNSLDIKNYLGRSYFAFDEKIGSVDAIRYPIIDIERLIIDKPDYYLSKNINSMEANTFSFSNFNRYEYKLTKTDNFSNGIGIGFAGFKLGTTKKFHSSFTQNIVNENNRVFGELNVKIKGNSYSFLTSSSTLLQIKEKYLNPTFLSELYNTTQSEFIKNFGHYVITGFTSGGLANALYTGINKSNSSGRNQRIRNGPIN